MAGVDRRITHELGRERRRGRPRGDSDSVDIKRATSVEGACLDSSLLAEYAAPVGTVLQTER